MKFEASEHSPADYKPTDTGCAAELPTESSFAERLEWLRQAAEERPYARSELREPDSNVVAMVRHGIRPIGPPMEFFPEAVDHRGNPLQSSVDCLEVVSMDHVSDIDPVTPDEIDNFMGRLYEYSPWPYVAVDNVGDSQVTQWCAEHGWQQLDMGPQSSFFHTEIPSDRVIDSTIVSATDEPDLNV